MGAPIHSSQRTGGVRRRATAHALLQDRAESREWYGKAVSAWRALEKEAAFATAYRKEMEAAEAGLR